ncbi:MAG: hypothetical protein K2Q20_02680 [Phycisphaerales bacterium]|nr:hypothetical protein [Phycisphaerales bacterium]
MTPEYMAILAAAERERTHTTEAGQVIRYRLPQRLDMRDAVRLTKGDTDAAADTLSLAAVISWTNVKASDLGLPEGAAGVDEKEDVSCSPATVRLFFGDDLARFDAYKFEFMEELNKRTAKLEADRKNSPST